MIKHFNLIWLGDLMLQGRHFKLECVNRIYDDRNATVWTDYLYGSQVSY